MNDGKQRLLGRGIVVPFAVFVTRQMEQHQAIEFSSLKKHCTHLKHTIACAE